jgi:hypothetical protein
MCDNERTLTSLAANLWMDPIRTARSCVMLETLRNLKISEIELLQPLPALEGEWLLGCLLSKRGVVDARWVASARKLLIEYDVDLVGSGELIDCMHICGIPIVEFRRSVRVVSRHAGRLSGVARS